MTANLNGAHARGDAVALPLVPQQDLHTINRLFQARQALTFRLGARTLRVTPQWQDADPAIADTCTIALNTSGGEGELVLPKPLLNAVLADLDPALNFDALDSQQRAILVEHALAGGLQALEAGTGSNVSLSGIAAGGASGRAGGGQMALPFQLQVDGLGQFVCVLRLPSADAAKFVEFLDRAIPRERGLVDVPVSLSVRWAAVAMTLGEVRSLVPGDIILVDNACTHPGQAVAVIGEHLIAPVNVSAEGSRMGGQPRRARGSGLEWCLDKPTHADDAPANARLEDVPVRVLFEYGRGALALGEVTRLGADAALPVRASGDLDIIVNGARIGRGEPTQIGTATGIRVTRMAAA